MQASDWTSYNQLIQELIGGNIRRNTFSRLEMDLLLDLQMANVRKTARAELLRRYQRHVQRQMVAGTAAPHRFSRFLEEETRQRPSNPAPLPDALRRAS